jgi:hypothetical protein
MRAHRFDVAVSGGPGGSAGLGVSRRGVYMRQPHEAAAPASYTVAVTPQLHEVCCVCVCVFLAAGLAASV